MEADVVRPITAQHPYMNKNGDDVELSKNNAIDE